MTMLRTKIFLVSVLSLSALANRVLECMQLFRLFGLQDLHNAFVGRDSTVDMTTQRLQQPIEAADAVRKAHRSAHKSF